MSNYSKTSVISEGRVELHDILSLTGAEISINKLPKGASVLFVHAHKENEEIYGILSGKGKVVIDEEEIRVKEGDWLRIAPEGKRQLFASSEESLSYICIQTKANSLEGYTAGDAIVF